MCTNFVKNLRHLLTLGKSTHYQKKKKKTFKTIPAVEQLLVTYTYRYGGDDEKKKFDLGQFAC